MPRRTSSSAHRQALSDPEPGRRSRRRRAQPLHLHDGARRGAVPRSQAHQAGDAARSARRRVLPAHQRRTGGNAQHGHAGGDRRVRQRRRRHLSDRYVDDRIIRGRSDDAGAAAVQELCGVPLSAAVGRARSSMSAATAGSCRRASAAPGSAMAIARFFRFMAAHNFDWARTGHLPAFKQVLDSPQFRALPERRTSRRWRRSAGRCRATCSASRRSKASSARKWRRHSPARSRSRRALGDAEHRVNQLLAEVD